TALNHFVLRPFLVIGYSETVFNYFRLPEKVFRIVVTTPLALIKNLTIFYVDCHDLNFETPTPYGSGRHIRKR
ncbi:MAG: hypothetical protein IJM09_00980, partial [Neisseriaceae bacterium]|nr:hypothetical protein [Neisseriaceae bacterium]